MAEINLPKVNPETKENEEEWRNISQNLIQTLPKQIDVNGSLLCLYDGIWYPQSSIKGLVYLQKYFQPHKTDIILTSFPKSGTTWLRALTFSIINRSNYSLQNTPLLTTTIQKLVPLFEINLFHNDCFPDLDILTQPRIFATHSSYCSLPTSIKNSENKIVYICRNPLDQFISLWHFLDKIPSSETKPRALDKAIESLCQGTNGYGPFWDHILGYWNASIEKPQNVLFLKYEDMKKDNVMHLKKLANFLGFPFSEDEEKRGLIPEISNFCAFDNMKNLKVNTTGTNLNGIPNTAFYRKGEVGDFKNYLSSDMVEKIEKVIQEKLGHFGFSFNIS